jgi:uncharacterized protein
MDFRKIQKCGFDVSIIGLGCEHLEKSTPREIEAVIKTAIDHGINILDVFMPQAAVRDNIGNALIGVRDKVYLQGHMGAIVEDGQYKRSREIKKCALYFEDFMTRYKTDYVDIGMIHFVDTVEDYRIVSEDGLLEYALKLKAQGKIRALGISSHEPVTALKAVESGLFDVLMFSINPAYDMLPADTDIYDFFKGDIYKSENLYGMNKDRAKLYAECEKRGVGITVMKTLGAGQLLSEKASPFSSALTVPQCIHYALSQPGVCSTLIGCVKPQEVVDAVKYTSLTLEEKDYSFPLSNSPKYSMNGRCMYCNHCLPCPSHIDIGTVTKYLYLARASEMSNIPETIKEHYNLLKNTANECIQCGSCEQNCPFGVKIIENMKEAVKLFSK